MMRNPFTLILRCLWLLATAIKGRISLVFLITLIGAVAAVLCAKFTWPQPAQPSVSNVKFFCHTGSKHIFWFACEFIAKNEGGKPCVIEKFEIVFEDTTYQKALSAMYGSPHELNYITSNNLPETLGKFSREKFTIIGMAQNNRGPGDMPGRIDIKITFSTKEGAVPITKNVPIIKRQVQNMVFEQDAE